MTRRYGRGPRGHRVDGPVPPSDRSAVCPSGGSLRDGHWKSTTFVGGLTSRGFIAPYVTDGAMNGTIFKA